MDDDKILEILREIYRDKLEGEVEGLTTNARLVEDLALDSIRLLTLVIEVEDRFQVCLDEDDEAEILRVSDLVAVIRSKLDDAG